MMEALGSERLERRQIENLSKIVGLEKFEGLRFKYRPAGQLGRIFVKVMGRTEQGVDLKAVESGEEYKNVPPAQLSIGVGTRRESDPLVELLKENGMEAAQYLQRQPPESERQREEFRNNPDEWAESHLQGRNPVRGFSAPVPAGRGEFAVRRGPPWPQEEIRRPVPVNPGFSHQYGFQPQNYGPFPMARVPPEEPQVYPPFFPQAGGRVNQGPPGFRPRERVPFPEQSEQRSFHTPAERQPPGSPAHSGNLPSYHSGRQSRAASSRPAGPIEAKERREERQGDANDELRARLKTIEKQLHANKAKAAIESEMKRLATSINPVTDRGLLLQHETFAAIYAAEKSQKGGLALAGDTGVLLRNRCRMLGYMAEDITTYAQQKVAELGEDATEAEIAEVDKKILRCYQDKRVKAEEVLAKHPEWLRDNR